MPVKSSQSGARILTALELVAEHQPIGVSALARLLGDNLAAAQRAIATLHEGGWIRRASGSPSAWELTAHIHIVAQHAHGTNDLRRRARGPLEQLWRETGESVLLNVPDEGKFIVIDVYESPQHVRSAPPIGLVVPARASATAWAMLPWMSAFEQARYLGEAPDAALQDIFARTIATGFAISHGDVSAGSTNIAAPIFEVGGRIAGAVLLSIPNERAGDAEETRLGALVLEAAKRISRAPAPIVTA